MLCFDQKKSYQRWKNIAQWILQNISKNQRFQEIAKFTLADFYEMDVINGIAILLEVDEIYNILRSASHCLLVERLDGNG